MSELSKTIKPLHECIDSINKGCQESIVSSIKYHRDQCAEKIAKAERNRPIMALLDAAGFKIKTYYWDHGADFKVELGFFPSTRAGSRALADELRTIRLLIDTKLGTPGKELADDGESKGHVLFTLQPPDLPGMRITYTRRLSRGAKCKIVTTRSTYRRLVCEV
jgi:hypothetical protein